MINEITEKILSFKWNDTYILLSCFSGKSSLEYYLYTTKTKRKTKTTTGKRKDIFKIDIYLYNQDKFAVFKPSSIMGIKRWASVDSGTSFS